MAPDEKHGLVPFESSTSAASPNAQDQSLLEKQTRTLRLFSRCQLFAFSLVYLGTGYYVAGLVNLSSPTPPSSSTITLALPPPSPFPSMESHQHPKLQRD